MTDLLIIADFLSTKLFVYLEHTSVENAKYLCCSWQGLEKVNNCTVFTLKRSLLNLAHRDFTRFVEVFFFAQKENMFTWRCLAFERLSPTKHCIKTAAFACYWVRALWSKLRNFIQKVWCCCFSFLCCQHLIAWFDNGSLECYVLNFVLIFLYIFYQN